MSELEHLQQEFIKDLEAIDTGKPTITPGMKPMEILNTMSELAKWLKDSYDKINISHETLLADSTLNDYDKLVFSESCTDLANKFQKKHSIE